MSGLRRSDLLTVCEKIKNFSGVLMCEDLDKKEIGDYECGILNVDRENKGTHWVAFRKEPKFCSYFDPFNEPPSDSFKKFAGVPTVKADVRVRQDESSGSCGQLCAFYLHKTEGVGPEGWLPSVARSTNADLERKATEWFDRNQKDGGN